MLSHSAGLFRADSYTCKGLETVYAYVFSYFEQVTVIKGNLFVARYHVIGTVQAPVVFSL